MALSRVKTWVVGEVLTAADLNNEFNNILDNSVSLVTPWVGNFDLNGSTLILDEDADTSIDAATDDTIDITVAGADDFRITANTFTALSGSSIVVANGNLTVTDGQTTLADPGSQTNTVVTPLTVESTTSGTPAAGIGTGIVFNSESQDENPSNFGQIEFAATDITTGSEDTYFQVLTRVAGAALTAVYRFVATGAFKGIFTHANTADRTYTLPDFNWDFYTGVMFRGPSSIGSGSTRSLETFSSSSVNPYNGIHFYDGAFTLDNGHTLTLGAGKRRIIIVSNTSITINGAITTTGAGAAGGGSVAYVGVIGDPGTDQPGGGGGGGGGSESGGNGGSVLVHGCTLATGSAGSAGSSASAATQVTGSDAALILMSLFNAMGGAGGGGSSGSSAYPASGVAGGAGGGSIVLIAPTVTLGSTAVLTTSGAAGSVDGSDIGSGGGGAGNVYIACRSFTDSGATFTQTGGAGGNATAIDGGAGANGVKQIFIYA